MEAGRKGESVDETRGDDSGLVTSRFKKNGRGQRRRLALARGIAASRLGETPRQDVGGAATKPAD